MKKKKDDIGFEGYFYFLIGIVTICFAFYGLYSLLIFTDIYFQGEWECVEWSKKDVVGCNVTFVYYNLDNSLEDRYELSEKNCEKYMTDYYSGYISFDSPYIQDWNKAIVEVNDNCLKSIKVKYD